DLDGPEEPVARIPAVVEHALGPSCLVVVDIKARLTRFEPREGSPTTWERASSFWCPPTGGAASKRPDHLLLSPSGRYLLVEHGPISLGEGQWTSARAYLLEAQAGVLIRAIDLRKSWVRAGFARLPSGEEALFISAESYMSVQLIECASGQTLHE